MNAVTVVSCNVPDILFFLFALFLYTVDFYAFIDRTYVKLLVCSKSVLKEFKCFDNKNGPKY